MATCTQCGAELKPGTKFCENCGAKVSIFFEFTKHPDEKNNKLRFGFNSFVVKVLILTKKMYFCNP